MSSDDIVFNSGLKIYQRGHQRPFVVLVGHSVRFTVQGVPLDNEVVFELEVMADDAISLGYDIMIIEPNPEITGLEPSLGSKGVKKVAKSDRN